MDLRIRGAEQLGDLAKALRAAGDRDLKRELTRGLNRAAKPLRTAAQAAAKSELPQSGGLAAYVAKSKFTTRTLTGSNPAVSIQVKGGLAPATTDKGYVRHRVFGKGPWVSQEVKGGWFTQTMQDGAPAVRRELIQAIDDVADKIRRS